MKRQQRPATENQRASIRLLCNALGRSTPTEPLTYAAARELISQLSEAYRRKGSGVTAR